MSDMIVQGSPEWFQARLGKATASRIKDIIAMTAKSGPAASRKNYLAQLVVERLTGEIQETYQSPEMRRGTELEPDARAAYEFRREVTVEPVGFVVHPKIPESGASPDGLVGADGLIEIKVPNTATHIETLLGAPIAGEYMTQMQWQMACTGRKWCDHVSFDNRLPEKMSLHIVRVARDGRMIAELEDKVLQFLTEVDATYTKLLKQFGSVGVAA